MTCRGINGEVAFRFWATCSTGATALVGSWTGSAGRKDNCLVDGDRGADLTGAGTIVVHFSVVLATMFHKIVVTYMSQWVLKS